jgi:four helix bundle protein
LSGWYAENAVGRKVIDRPIRSHRDLIAWQKAMDLTVAVYGVTKCFPADERFGLTNQIRRASTSIPANVAEGQGRRSKREFVQFLGHARGSLLELESHLELALRLEYIEIHNYTGLSEQMNEVGRLINGLIRSLATDLRPLASDL